MAQDGITAATLPSDIDGRRAWIRLGAALAIGAIGSTGMWSVAVTIPYVQSDFAVSRQMASLPYTLAMIGFGVGGVAMGRVTDRFGVIVSILIGVALLGAGYIAAGLAQTMTQYIVAYGILIGLGTSSMFAPLMADISHWFRKRRGMAVSICACGNYLAGTIWPPVLQYFMETQGWRATHIGYGLFCLVSMPLLALFFRTRAPVDPQAQAHAAAWRPVPMGVSPGMLQVLLVIAGVACCVAMSMPQVHIVAYCGDLGYGPARGAQMLSLMLGLGVVSRLISGIVADRIGSLATLMLGSLLQGVALMLYLPFDGLVSLFLISGLFGLFQGGIVPMYALIVRDYFSPKEAGARVGLVIMATLFGMSFGGWVSGAIYDWTGSYHAAFVNGIVWNLVNVSIVAFLMWSRRGSRGIGTGQSEDAAALSGPARA
jgi:MFS family permease